MPWVIETTDPATKRPKPANIAHTYAVRPKPSGCSGVGGRTERRSASSRKISLPVSLQECAASATMDAEPERPATMVLAIAMRMSATKAKITVMRLEDSRALGRAMGTSRGLVPP